MLTTNLLIAQVSIPVDSAAGLSPGFLSCVREDYFAGLFIQFQSQIISNDINYTLIPATLCLMY